MISQLVVLLLLLSAAPAFAQGASIVSDPPVEISTAQTASELSQDIAVNTQTATSVTTGGGAGYFQGVAPYLDSLDANFNNGAINSSQTFAGLFPGWQALPADTIPASSAIATAGLATYRAALAAAQQQASGFDSEDTHLGALESGNQAASSVLQAIQINTEAMLAVAQQIQLLRQLTVAQITLDATKAGEELNERAQGEATSAQAANLGVSPQ
jgi:hypothetical protein